MSKRQTHDEVLEVAVELHAQDEAQAEAVRDREAVFEAAAELGVGPQHLAEAEHEVEVRRAAEALRKARRSRLARWALAVLAAVGLGWGLWEVATPAPPEPWTEESLDRGQWALDTSAGTVAQLDFERVGDHEVAVVTVTQASPREDGTWFVNLDGSGLPDFAGQQTLRIELSGTMPAARVYLEAGSNERWRSPPIAVQAAATEHRLPLSAFEHQRREGGEWHVVDEAEPSGITVVSVKLGHYVNPPEAVGVVRVGEIGVE